uniref:Vesicle transport protein n=1 Tax=Pyrodinium bahamense TaxID=73915 RepID=A0A7S0B7B1_9DINO
MGPPYMNVHKEPLNVRSSLNTAFGFLRQPQPPEEEEELGNPYMGIHEEEAVLQEAFHRQSSFGNFLGSLVPGFLKNSAADASARDLKPEKAGLLRSLTPRFLRSDEDEDFASACCPRLGFKQRLFGCACCFLLGQLMQFCSFGAATGILLGRPGRFACLYTLGNLVMMAASFFLSGPKAQCRKIKAKDRALTSFVYFSTMFLTLAAVFAGPFFCRALVILALVVVQWLSLVWYVLSYVPYGHSMGRRVLRSVGGWCCSF